MKQEEYLGFGSLNRLEEVLRSHNAENIFLVTGKGFYESSV